MSAGKSTGEERPENLDHRTLSGVFFLGASLAVIACFFLYFENKLFSFGLLYKNLHNIKKPEPNHYELRKVSRDIQKRLLVGNKGKSTSEYPDISSYLASRRRNKLLTVSLYSRRRRTGNQDSSRQLASANESAILSV